MNKITNIDDFRVVEGSLSYYKNCIFARIVATSSPLP